jgi:hypothetical protein
MSASQPTEAEREAAALDCVRRGWSLVALNGKIPVQKGWATALPTTEAEAAAIGRRGNFGIRTGAISGVVVLDVDPRHGGDASLDALGLDLSGVPCVRTGSGGRHFYFAYPDGGLRNSAGTLGLGLDIRGDGGQVVAPSSLHPETGEGYRWEATPNGALPPYPSGLRAQAKAIPKGQRQTALTALAGYDRHLGKELI